MNIHASPHSRILLMAALLVACLLPATAGAKPQKHRGVIAAIDLQEQSMMLIKPGKPDKDKTVYWADGVTCKPGSISSPADLKPGMYVRCMVDAATGKISVIRHLSDQDIPVEDLPARVKQ